MQQLNFRAKRAINSKEELPPNELLDWDAVCRHLTNIVSIELAPLHVQHPMTMVQVGAFHLVECFA